MKKRVSSLMAVAMAGILGPSAEATIYTETSDYSNNGVSPTSLGAFNPASDGIQGGLNFSDNTDTMLVSGTPSAPISLPISFNMSSGNYLSWAVYDDAGFVGGLTSESYNTSSGNNSLEFTVPADGDYMIYLNNESSSVVSYTIGVVPEPSTIAMMGAAATLGLGSMLRRRKQQ